MSEAVDRLQALFAEVISEARTNAGFARRLERIFASVDRAATPSRPPRTARNRRASGAFDPFTAYAEGADSLRTRLAALDVEQLKDIVAEHGMDHSKLALKWRSSDRLVDLIVRTVAFRAVKGHAFRDETLDMADFVCPEDRTALRLQASSLGNPTLYACPKCNKMFVEEPTRKVRPATPAEARSLTADAWGKPPRST